MTQELIITLVALGVSVFVGLIGIVVAIARGDMKKYIEERMIEAEKLDLSGEKKLAFVINAVKEKYKVLELILNAKKFVEHIIELSKQINFKK